MNRSNSFGYIGDLVALSVNDTIHRRGSVVYSPEPSHRVPSFLYSEPWATAAWVRPLGNVVENLGMLVLNTVDDCC